MPKINPYLMFNGDCEAAFRYYEKHLGGTMEGMMKYKEAPADNTPAPEKGEGCAGGEMPVGMDEKIMHACLIIDGVMLMGSDSPPGMFEKPQGITVTLNVDTVADAERCFKALADGGKVTMPLQETFWAKSFGMTTDRFGIPWMVNCIAA